MAHFNHLKAALQRIKNTEGSADRVARSFAVGSFFALLPTFGFGIVFAGLTLLLLNSLNRTAVIAAFVVWNPIVQIPLYLLSFQIGASLFAGAPVLAYNVELLNHVVSLTRRLLVGNLIITTILTSLSYLTVFVLIRTYKRKPIFPVSA